MLFPVPQLLLHTADDTVLLWRRSACTAWQRGWLQMAQRRLSRRTACLPSSAASLGAPMLLALSPLETTTARCPRSTSVSDTTSPMRMVTLAEGDEFLLTLRGLEMSHCHRQVMLAVCAAAIRTALWSCCWRVLWCCCRRLCTFDPPDTAVSQVSTRNAFRALPLQGLECRALAPAIQLVRLRLRRWHGCLLDWLRPVTGDLSKGSTAQLWAFHLHLGRSSEWHTRCSLHMLGPRVCVRWPLPCSCWRHLIICSNVNVVTEACCRTRSLVELGSAPEAVLTPCTALADAGAASGLVGDGRRLLPRG